MISVIVLIIKGIIVISICYNFAITILRWYDLSCLVTIVSVIYHLCWYSLGLFIIIILIGKCEKKLISLQVYLWLCYEWGCLKAFHNTSIIYTLAR